MSQERNFCLTPGAGGSGGYLRLPVAPRSNTRLRFGAPGSPGRALQPKDVVQWVGRLLAEGKAVAMAEVYGPGDPLAEPGPALETLRLMRGTHPGVALTLTTVGLNGAAHAEVLAALGLSHVTVLVDAVDPAVAAALYAWIRPGQRTLALDQAASLLVQAQAEAIAAFKKAGLFVKVNTTLYPGVNDGHVEEIARSAASLGADLMALAPFQPQAPAPSAAAGCAPSSCSGCGVSGCALPDEAETPPARPDAAAMAAAAEAAARHLPLCAQEVLAMERGAASPSLDPQASMPRPTAERPHVAVASSGGLEVDLHLGQAIRFLIYGPRPSDGLASLLGVREAPEPGGGDGRWLALAETLRDCFAVLAASAGENPRQVLAAYGVAVLTTEADVQAAVDVLYGGGRRGRNGKG